MASCASAIEEAPQQLNRTILTKRTRLCPYDVEVIHRPERGSDAIGKTPLALQGLDPWNMCSTTTATPSTC